ncbi:hypothetical protein CVD28_19225 [Bacillus sp. M6-12]|nr:hypothetical protein CVD28_19225 [Bacillus sp. M6-12]
MVISQTFGRPKAPSVSAYFMLVGGPHDVGQDGVATERGDLSRSSSDQGACAFLIKVTNVIRF